MPAPRSPEIISEPVVHDDLLAALAGYNTQFAREVTPHSFHSPAGPVIPSGLLGAAVDFIAYWQAVGPRLAQHGNRHRAEVEATFDLAFAEAGLPWTCWGSGQRDVYVCNNSEGHLPPLFSARWVLPGDPGAKGLTDQPRWYTEHGAWSLEGGTYHDTIAEMLDHHRARIEAAA